MPVLSDQTLIDRDFLAVMRAADPSHASLIHPFVREQIRNADDDRPVISYGLSSYGYDIRVGGRFEILTSPHPWASPDPIDPKAFDPEILQVVEIPESSHPPPVAIPPRTIALAASVETFHIPRDVVTLCVGKSTYARCGLIVNVTPFEPEWEGVATLELSNTTPFPILVYPYEGIAQVLFFQGDRPCRTSYADTRGRYQGQTGITEPRVGA